MKLSETNRLPKFLMILGFSVTLVTPAMSASAGSDSSSSNRRSARKSGSQPRSSPSPHSTQRPTPSSSSSSSGRTSPSGSSASAWKPTARPVGSQAQADRREIERVTRKVDELTHREERRVTSRDRADSAAHRRGAIDVGGTDRERAKDYSAALPRRHSVLVEQPKPNGTQTNTYFRDGRQEYSRSGRHEPDKSKSQYHAKGPHTHIQPDPPDKRRPVDPKAEGRKRAEFYERYFREQHGEHVPANRRSSAPSFPSPAKPGAFSSPAANRASSALSPRLSSGPSGSVSSGSTNRSSTPSASRSTPAARPEPTPRLPRVEAPPVRSRPVPKPAPTPTPTPRPSRR